MMVTESPGACSAPPPPPRTNWTRLVPHPVLIGQASAHAQVSASTFPLAAPPLPLAAPPLTLARPLARPLTLALARPLSRRLALPRAEKEEGAVRLAAPRACPPSLPTVAPTRVPTVHSLPPSLLLPLPVSLLYTSSVRCPRCAPLYFLVVLHAIAPPSVDPPRDSARREE